MKKDISDVKDVKLLVHKFYGRVRENPLIGPIFIGVLKDDWDAHLKKLTGFWQTVLLNQPAYTGSPFRPHAQLPIEKKHFDVWLGLFYQTVNENFEGEKAEEAKLRATKMAEMFLMKINFYKEHPEREVL